MKHKAVFIDVDGTLLTDNLTISEGTKEVLGKLHNQGVLISIVTARPPTACFYFYEELRIPHNPLICFNGALILQNNKILHEESIPTSHVTRIIDEVKEFVVNISLYRHQDWYTEQIDRWTRNEVEITGSRITETNFSGLVHQDFKPNKILCMGEAPEIDALEKHLKKLGFSDLNIHKSKPTYLEIVNKKASKSQGIQHVTSSYGINREETISIGDNFNDVDMLIYAGTSIAMGNAPDEVKRFATMITDSNNHEGIQKALVKLFNLR